MKFEFTSLPELGFGGAETIRLTKTGVVDIAEFYLGYVSGELPIVEMLEIPGLFADQEAMHKAFLAWKPHLAKIIDEKVNGVLLATAFQTDQFLFSKKPIRKLEDFKDLKTRVHSVAIAQLLAGLGGSPPDHCLCRSLHCSGAGNRGWCVYGGYPRLQPEMV